jgi:outer membrane protein OmpA-like peptidoglycan-associated protein
MKPRFFLSLFVITFSLTFFIIPRANAQGGGDTRRRTVAITYFRDPVEVIFSGTTLRPVAKGKATVERWRKRNSSEIEITIENLIPAYNYGGDYTTYVLWAITPTGQVDNLGEFRLSGSTAKLKTSTPHQTFALIVTAEPHYLVRLPSKMVVLENLAPTSKNVQIQASELYFTGDSGKYYTDNTAPAVAERDYNKTPPELLQARRALQITRLADGEKYAPEDFSQASKSLDQAEAAFRKGANVHEVGRLARESISYSVRARDISEERALAAERRADIARRDAELRQASESASDLQGKLSDTETRLRASEIARANTEDQLSRAVREAADARAENRSLKSDNDRLQSEVDRLTRELASARGMIDRLQNQYESTSLKVEEMERVDRERREFEARRRDFIELQAALAKIVTVKPVGNSFVVVLPDNLFVPNQAALHVRAKARMDALGQAIAAHQGVKFTIEGHSDARQSAEGFALGRAQSVADYIAAYGVPKDSFAVESRGATVPVAKGRTAAARAQNRRIEIVFVAPQ